MADIYSKDKRSNIMSRVLGRGNLATEATLAKILRQHGIRGWRRHLPLPGRPDFAFPAQRIAVFVDGCFWHMCPLHSSMPTANRLFWRRKLAQNVQRDRRTRRDLQARGWRVIRIWQHELHARTQNRCVDRIQRALQFRAARKKNNAHEI